VQVIILLLTTIFIATPLGSQAKKMSVEEIFHMSLKETEREIEEERRKKNIERNKRLRRYIEEAEQGNISAQRDLGNLYANGQDLPQNYKEAVKWYRKAAEKGHPGAQNELGAMYLKGKGVPQDHKKAYAWANIASSQGYKPAKSNREAALKKMKPKAVEAAQKLSEEYYRKYVGHGANEKTLGYKIKDGVFSTSEGIIPNGCFGQLMAELNGDDTIASIYISKSSIRGCIKANYPYPGGKEDYISYKIVKELGNNKFNLNICQKVDGSMEQSCSKVIIQFKNREYSMPDGTKQVLTIDKLGEW